MDIYDSPELYAANSSTYGANQANLAMETVRYGPMVLVDAITDGIMDSVQTPEGIAALSGQRIFY